MEVSNSNWKEVEKVMGHSGTLMPGDVFRFNIYRTDLHVKVRDVKVAPTLALGTWVAFKDEEDTSIVMGDLALTLDEIDPVMQTLQQGGIEQTALHNHLLGESPRVMYMHISGHGDSIEMAKIIHKALALTKTPAEARSSDQPMNDGLDTDMLDKAIGVKGKWNKGIYQFSVPRKEKITDSGMEIPPAMGVATGIGFQPLGNEEVAVFGGFSLIGDEVNHVIKVLGDNDIIVTGIANLMIYEEPRLFTIHFWATGDQYELANGLKEALDKTNSSRPG